MTIKIIKLISSYYKFKEREKAKEQKMEFFPVVNYPESLKA